MSATEQQEAARRRQVTDLLGAIEQEMRRIELWETAAPTAEALASSVPFCFDTLRFHQWLQWVFVARMRALLDAGAALPGNCAIAPLAEHSFAELPHDTARLLPLLQQIDQVISRP